MGLSSVVIILVVVVVNSVEGVSVCRLIGKAKDGVKYVLTFVCLTTR